MTNSRTCPSCNKEFLAPPDVVVKFCPKCGALLENSSVSQDDSSEIRTADIPEQPNTPPLYAAPMAQNPLPPPLETTAAAGKQAGKSSGKKAVGIIGACAVAAAIIIALVILQPWSVDATRKEGEFPNMPAVISQMSEWDEATWNEKMGIDASGILEDLSGQYRSIDDALLSRENGRAILSLLPASDNASGEVTTFVAITYVTGNTFVYTKTDAYGDSKTAFPSDEIVALQSSSTGRNYDDTGVKLELAEEMLNASNDAFGIIDFGRADAEQLLSSCGISPNSITDVVEARRTVEDFAQDIANIRSLDYKTLPPASTEYGQCTQAFALSDIAYKYGCITKDSKGKNMYVTVEASRSATIYYTSDGLLSDGYYYPEQICMKPQSDSLAHIIVTASSNSTVYDLIAFDTGAEIKSDYPQEQSSELTIDTPYYTIMLPGSWAGDFTVDKDEKLSSPQENLGTGCTTTINRSNGEMFIVECFTDAWGPQGDFTSQDLGAPSNLDGWHVCVYAPNLYDDEGNYSEPDISTYALYVTVK